MKKGQRLHTFTCMLSAVSIKTVPSRKTFLTVVLLLLNELATLIAICQIACVCVSVVYVCACVCVCVALCYTWLMDIPPAFTYPRTTRTLWRSAENHGETKAGVIWSETSLKGGGQKNIYNPNVLFSHTRNEERERERGGGGRRSALTDSSLQRVWVVVVEGWTALNWLTGGSRMWHQKRVVRSESTPLLPVHAFCYALTRSTRSPPMHGSQFRLQFNGNMKIKN